MNKETKPDAPELPPLPDFQPVWCNIMTVDGTKRVAVYNALVDMLHAYARAALAARQPEPVAWVDVPDTDIGPYEFHGMKLLPVGKHHLYAQPPADLKDAQRLDFLESLLNRTEFQNSKRPAEPVSADMHFHGDAGCSLYIRDLFGNVVRCGSAGTVRSTIDSAMLSSAPTGEAK